MGLRNPPSAFQIAGIVGNMALTVTGANISIYIFSN
jgi:hypothetical protein